MENYQQLSLYERQIVSVMKKRGDSVVLIAAYLGRHRSTIYRELMRNQHTEEFYCPQTAHRKALSRCQRTAHKQIQPRLRQYVGHRLIKAWSPEQIAGRLKRVGSSFAVCTETIYQMIYSQYGCRKGWIRQLPQAKSKRGRIGARKRAKYLNLRPISERSAAANKRHEFGHWEGDSVQFRTSNNRRHLTTLVERTTRYSQAILQQRMVSSTVMGRIKKCFAEQPIPACKSLTLDQGTEFAYYQILERVEPYQRRKMTTYYCDVKAPWQKGAVENFNRRIRRFLPRNFDVYRLTEQKLEAIVKMMNETPRKCLGFQTPAEAYRLACRTSH